MQMFRSPVVLFALVLFIAGAQISAAAYLVAVPFGLALSGLLLAGWAWLVLGDLSPRQDDEADG